MSRQAAAQPTTTETDLVSVEQPTADVQPALRLRLVRPDNQRRVVWQADTVDNEHMGKKKSKCCCVYRKPRPFDESSSDEEDDCANCVGHRKPKPASADSQPDDGQAGASQPCGGQSE